MRRWVAGGVFVPVNTMQVIGRWHSFQLVTGWFIHYIADLNVFCIFMHCLVGLRAALFAVKVADIWLAAW